MKNFRVHYSGACFESGDSVEQVERRVQNAARYIKETGSGTTEIDIGRFFGPETK